MYTKWDSSPLPSTRVCSSAAGCCFGGGPESIFSCPLYYQPHSSVLQGLGPEGPLDQPVLTLSVMTLWMLILEDLRFLLSCWNKPSGLLIQNLSVLHKPLDGSSVSQISFPALSLASRGCLFCKGSVGFQSWKIQAHSPSRFPLPPRISQTELWLYYFVPPVRRMWKSVGSYVDRSNSRTKMIWLVCMGNPIPPSIYRAPTTCQT